MTARLMALLAAVIAIAAIAVGCGGGGGNSGSTGSGGSGAEPGSGVKPVQTGSLSKAQFIKQASAFCRRSKVGLIEKTEAYLAKHISDGLSQPVLYADAAKAVLIPVVEARIAAIRKLGAPAGDEEEVAAMLAGQEEGIEQMKKLKAFVEGDSFLPYFAQSTKAFETYGLAECGYDL